MTITDRRQFSRATASACRPIRTFRNLTIRNQSHSLSRTPAIMPEAHDPLSTAGLGPDSKPLEDMNNLSQINPLACAGACGAAAGHAAAVCVSARCENAGAGVYDARNARVSSTTTTLPLPVVARQDPAAARLVSRGVWVVVAVAVKQHRIQDTLPTQQPTRSRPTSQRAQPALLASLHTVVDLHVEYAEREK